MASGASSEAPVPSADGESGFIRESAPSPEEQRFRPTATQLVRLLPRRGGRVARQLAPWRPLRSCWQVWARLHLTVRGVAFHAVSVALQRMVRVRVDDQGQIKVQGRNLSLRSDLCEGRRIQPYTSWPRPKARGRIMGCFYFPFPGMTETMLVCVQAHLVAFHPSTSSWTHWEAFLVFSE